MEHPIKIYFFYKCHMFSATFFVYIVYGIRTTCSPPDSTVIMCHWNILRYIEIFQVFIPRGTWPAFSEHIIFEGWCFTNKSVGSWLKLELTADLWWIRNATVMFPRNAGNWSFTVENPAWNGQLKFTCASPQCINQPMRSNDVGSVGKSFKQLRYS